MTTYQARRRPSLLAIAVVVLAVIAAGALGLYFGRSTSNPTSKGSATTLAPTGSSAPAATASTAAPTPLTVASVTPTAGAVGVAANAPIRVTFSAPLATGSPTPTLSPPATGSWAISGASATFTPTADFLPLTTVTLTVPSGSGGVHGTSGGLLGSDYTEHFRVANGSVLRIQQLLSLLDYSPLSFAASGTAIAAGDTAGQVAALYTPPSGTFSWTSGGWPRQLRRLWQEGRYSVFTRGLVMSFQADHGLTPNGRIGPALWSALVGAVSANTVNTGGYNFALANKASPERFTVWHNGAVVLTSPANTGIADSPTPDGTFPVNTRLRSQVMRGTNPNGAKYADLVQYIAYFNGNDAVHYMDRADYGIPQSLGCVELPLTDAAHAWPYLAYGTLVSIIN